MDRALQPRGQDASAAQEPSKKTTREVTHTTGANTLGGSFVDATHVAFDKNGRITMLHLDDDAGVDDTYAIAEMQRLADARQKYSTRMPHPGQGSRHPRGGGASVCDVPKMSICIMIVGTQGDVQPFVGIAKRLQEDGHRVRLATHAVYRGFVTKHGVEFYPLGGDPKELAAYMVKTGGHLIPTKFETIQKDVPRNLQMIDEILNSTWPAVSAADPDAGGPGVPGKPFQAQAIISNPVTYGHIHVAERLGVPLHIMFPQPWVPTVAFPHPLANMPYNNKPSKRNFMSYKLVDLLMWQGTETIVNEFRTDVLGLRKIRKGDGGRDMLLDLSIPHAFMWSPALVPKPGDWSDLYDVVGTVTLKAAGSNYTPTPELEAFLGNDGGPIFVGFGSMVIADPKKTTSMIIEAAKLANARVLIQSSWSDMAAGLDVPDNIFFIGNCPHDWLMPRVSAVVHHGGAGTTAAGLMAGKPTFIVPFFGDQPFWGRAVVNAGVGVEPCPIAELTVAKLHAAFEGLQRPELRASAMKIREVLLAEDGVGNAVDCFYKHLPLKNMRCDLGCNRIATKWSRKDRMKLCDQCEFVVSSRLDNSADDMLGYHAVDYSARGPDSALAGYASGTGAFMHEMSGAMTDIFTKPAQGYKEDGAKGAMIGLVVGMGNMIIRPCQGAALFVDHVATGHYNQSRGSDERKKGTVLLDNKGLRSAVGMRTAPEAHTGVMKADEQLHVKKKTSKDRQQIAVHLTSGERLQMEARFRDRMTRRLQHHSSGSMGSDTTPEEIESSDDVPPMNICVMATGSWDESVQQFVAIGLRLKADGHRVRLATHTGYRDRIVAAGLEFFPLGGRPTTIGSFLGFVYGKSHDPSSKRSRGMFGLGRLRNREVFPEVDDLKELVFSLWPACVDVDPLAPGRLFRADAIISHPLIFGQAVVAERLGVPLHCMSPSPLSRTQAFPHLMAGASSPVNFKLATPYRYAPSNAESYDAVSKATWEETRHLLDDLRVSLGLPGKSVDADLLAEWSIPHSYLWDPALLPPPTDWEQSELCITGYVQLEDPPSMTKDPTTTDALQGLRAFASAARASSTSIVYVGFARGDWDRRQVTNLLQSIEVAARKVHVRVVFQLHEEEVTNSDGHSAIAISSPDAVVLEVSPHLPRKPILDVVQAALHWGDLSITSCVLAAGKPACVVARNPTQRFWGQALASAGLGVEPLEIDMLSSDNLAYVLQTLLAGSLAANAQRFAAQMRPSNAAAECAVRSFYENLPLSAMRCDLDPARVARLYDPVRQLKLSYEAHVVARQLSSSESESEGETCSDSAVKYKPIRYSLGQPPRLSLRGYKEDAFTLRRMAKHAPPAAYSYDAVETQGHSMGKMLRGQFARHQSVVLEVVEVPPFWSSAEEQRASTASINAAYEQLIREEAAQRHSG